MKDPSAFKHHLLNDITYDREMFFDDASMTADKVDLWIDLKLTKYAVDNITINSCLNEKVSINTYEIHNCPRGEIGRHKGLKILALLVCQFESG